VGQNASGHRAIDIDVSLAGFTGGRNLPAEQFSARLVFDFRLDRVPLDTVARSQRGIEAGEFGPGAPMPLQGF
jgi:hypothetical protein